MNKNQERILKCLGASVFNSKWVKLKHKVKTQVQIYKELKISQALCQYHVSVLIDRGVLVSERIKNKTFISLSENWDKNLEHKRKSVLGTTQTRVLDYLKSNPGSFVRDIPGASPAAKSQSLRKLREKGLVRRERHGTSIKYYSL